jgi:hypothetical protein
MAKGYKKIDLQSLPACAAEFIKLVIKKMRYRKKVRRDVQAELAAHFEDELKDCKTDEDREQKAQHLIVEFGDVKLLGILLRRAKKRCRPLWRKALVRSFQVVGIVVLYILICFAPLVIGTPAISVNYIDWLNELVRVDRDEIENAKLYYDQAIKLYVECPAVITKKNVGSSKRGCGFNSDWLTDFNDLEMKHLSKWLTDNKPAFEKVREGAEKLCYWPIYHSDGADSTEGIQMLNVMKPLSGYRNIARALAWQIRYKAYRADIESALNECIVLQKFAGHLQGKGLLVEQLVGIGNEALAHRSTFMILAKVDVPGDVLKNVQEELEEIYAKQSVVINLEGEKAFWYDLVQRGFTDDGKGGGRVLKNGLPLVVKDAKSSLMGFFLWDYPDRRDVTNTIDKYFQEAKELLAKTPWQLHARGLTQKWDEIGKECFMLKMIGPAHGSVGQLGWRVKTARLGLLTVLAVLRYEKEKGKYPEDLEELVAAGYLRKLPMDPFSNKPVVYKKMDDDFTLYSVGLNFEDDGGTIARGDNGRIHRWADEGDEVFWPVPRSEVRQEK